VENHTQDSGRTESEFFDNWVTQLRKGTLQLHVLCALRGQPLYGYDIVRQLRGIDGLVIGEGTVYPILSRLKREGLVTTTLMASSEGPARKYYELTPHGQHLVHRMLEHWRAIRGGIDARSGGTYEQLLSADIEGARQAGT
jgi:PadR family transcriptional regulator, regulatory protein PadR